LDNLFKAESNTPVMQLLINTGKKEKKSLLVLFAFATQRPLKKRKL